MALRGEVYHHIRVFLLKETVNGLPVCDVFLYEAEVRIVHDRSQGGKIARVSQAVQTDNPVIRIFFQHVENKVASDKTGAAGNNNLHNLIRSLSGAGKCFRRLCVF